MRTAIIATGLCAALSAAMPAQARTLGGIAFEPCTLSPEFAARSVEAQCAKFPVPENPAAPNGRRIALAIAWVPAEDAAEEDPVFMLAGGPGQSARESYPQIEPAFREVHRKRHILLVDQRGTGESNRLICRDGKGKSAVMEPGDDSPEAARAFAERCRATLAKKADLRFYATGDAVRDLDAVRAAIGVDRIDLVGISYGTRVAQQYLRRYPQRTRAVVLDGVVPNELMLGSEHARNLEAALDLQFAQCAKTPACAKTLGSPRAHLRALQARLKTAPPTVRYRDPVTAEPRTETLTPGHLQAVVRLYAYLPAAAAMLPLILHEAAAGRYAPLAAQARLMEAQLGESIMHGMQLSVVCTEDAAGLRADAADADSVLGTGFIEFVQAQCAVWPKGALPRDFHAPLRSGAPVLLLSGEYDPVTPPRYGEQVVKGLPNGRHLVLRGQGHNALPVGCMPKLLARFLDTADAQALDASCLDGLRYTPPFAGFYGWEP